MWEDPGQLSLNLLIAATGLRACLDPCRVLPPPRLCPQRPQGFLERGGSGWGAITKICLCFWEKQAFCTQTTAVRLSTCETSQCRGKGGSKLLLLDTFQMTEE